MHIDHPNAHVGGDFARLRDGVGNIVVFQIEKEFETLMNQAFRQTAPRRGKQLFADFDLAQGRVKVADESERVFLVGKIEGDDNGSTLLLGLEVGDQGIHKMPADKRL